MDTSTHIIEGLRDAATRKRIAALVSLEQAKREVERAEIEISAFEMALVAVGAVRSSAGDASPKAPVAIASRSMVGATHLQPVEVVTSFSEPWMAVFRDLFNNAVEPYSYGDVEAAAIRQGNNSTLGSLRAQMMKAVNGHLFKRVKAGNFSITEHGKALIVASPNENGPPSGSPDAEKGETFSKESARNDDGTPRSLFP
jgi:hypothetical protein